jgi:hypothetical protein
MVSKLSKLNEANAKIDGVTSKGPALCSLALASFANTREVMKNQT